MPYITSIFYSVDGEVNSAGGQGNLTVFVRFAGCSLRCWGGNCDTTYSYKVSKEQWMSNEEIINKIHELSPSGRRVTITGGEPLEQCEGVIELASELKKFRPTYRISLETNGAHDIREVGARLIDSFVLDHKCPSTGVNGQMILENYHFLNSSDWVKFVIANEVDFDYAIALIIRLDLNSFPFNIAFSPKHGELEPRKLIEWMKKDATVYPKAVLNLQLHKYIWPELINAGPGKEV